jgi:hypothetical protein
MDDGRSMRVVKGSLGHSSKERYRELDGASFDMRRQGPNQATIKRRNRLALKKH